MRSLKAMLSTLIFLVVAGLPVAAYALRVTANGIVIGSSTTTVDVEGVLTTTVDLVDFTTADGFTITGSAIAEQSGSEERILFQNVSLTGPTGCSIDLPCFLSLTASSDPTDFAPKAPGGYPAAVLFSASVSGGAENKLSGTGDNNADIINGDPGGSAVSVPWTCTGTEACAFTTSGDPSADFFGDVGFETIQLTCAQPPCTPSQSFTLNLKIIGTTVNIPAAGTVESRTGSPEPLIGTIPPLSGTSLKLSETKVEITRLEGFPDLSNANFKLTTTFAVNGNGINPLDEIVRVSLGTLLLTIPGGSFSEIPGGRFSFKGTIDAVPLKAQIAPLGGGTWEFKADGEGANLAGTRKPVPVGLQIGDDSGAGWASRAKFLD